MKMAALLFDMDGVVVDTEPVHEASRQLTYREYAIPTEVTKDIPVIGRNTDAIFADVAKRVSFPVDLKTAIRRKRDVFVDLLGGQVEPLPGVCELLKWAKEQKIKTALVTASARQNVEAVLRGTGLTGFFDVLVVAEDVTHWKPHPEGYLTAAHRLGVAPMECVVLEDSPVGVASGKAAGMRVVGVQTGQGGRTPKEADLVISNLNDGKELLHKFLQES